MARYTSNTIHVGLLVAPEKRRKKHNNNVTPHSVALFPRPQCIQGTEGGNSLALLVFTTSAHFGSSKRPLAAFERHVRDMSVTCHGGEILCSGTAGMLQEDEFRKHWVQFQRKKKYTWPLCTRDCVFSLWSVTCFVSGQEWRISSAQLEFTSVKNICKTISCPHATKLERTIVSD